MTVAPGPGTIWQADLGILNMLARQNSGFAYYLLCIDCFTRKIYVEALKRKTAAEVIGGFRSIFKRANALPWKIITDQGKEFIAGSVQEFFKRRQIQHFCNFTSPIFHAGMAERANRTLKERMYKYFTEKSTKRWINIIQALVHSINQSPNRSIGGLIPEKAHLFTPLLRKYFERVQRKKEKKSKRKVNMLNVGQRVRIEKTKDIFQKGYRANFTEEIYTIKRVRHTAPVTYEICDEYGEPLKGWFYREDICPVYSKMGKNWEIEQILDEKTIIRGNMPLDLLLVKWRGHTDDYNTWIPKKSIKIK
jgi:hypothetical protein